MTTASNSEKIPQDSMVGQTLKDGEYRIERVIGHGGMGKVYLAAHAALTIPLAIKEARADEALPDSTAEELQRLLHENITHTHAKQQPFNDFPTSGGEHTDRFLREALFLARLRHVAIPTLYDYFFEHDHWYLVMDYVPGPTLLTYLRQYGPLLPLEAMNYAMQLCDVLDYLHQQTPPIIFRDLKPSNIILTPDGALMLIDFGIARYFKEGQINDTTDFGSPGYASPEQYQGAGQTDARSDLYSLGVILHEMLTGQRPTGPGNAIRDSAQQLNANVSTILSSLVLLATRTEPSYRFQSAHTFYLALDRTYYIEEQHAYLRHIQHEQFRRQIAQQTTQALAENQALASALSSSPNQHTMSLREPVAPAHTPSIESDPAFNEVPVIQSLALSLAQRQKTREALQKVRQQRMVQEDIEHQLASIDESLKMRSAIPLSYAPQPFLEEVEDSIPLQAVQQPPARSTQYVINGCFIAALLIFFVVSGMFVYTRVVPYQTQITKSKPGTAIASRTIQSTWRILPSLSSPQADNTVMYVQVQGRSYIYMSGGYRGPNSSPHYDRNLYRYDILAAHWEQVPVERFPGMVNNAVAQDEQGRLFFTTGYSTESYAVTSLLYMYQPADNTMLKITPPPPISIGFGAAILADQRGHLYITQGFLKSGDATQASTGWYRYDIASGEWHILTSLPQGLGYVVLAQDDPSTLLLMGGSFDAGQKQQTNSIYRYTIAQDSWSKLSEKTPLPMSGVASCASGNGQLVIIGGADAIHNTGLARTWLVDLRTLRWTPLTNLPSGGSILGAASSDNHGHIYLVRGATDSNHPTADFWELTLQE